MSKNLKPGTRVRVGGTNKGATVIEPLPDQFPWCEQVRFDNGETALPRRESLKVVKAQKKAAKETAASAEMPDFGGIDTALSGSMWPEDGAT